VKPVEFYWFSGTGNTALVVAAMCKVFAARGVGVVRHRLETSDPLTVRCEGTLGLAFPVAGFATYPFIFRWFKALPAVDGVPVFMVDTLGGFSGGIVGPLRRWLAAKGYRPVGAREIVMPPNIFFIKDDVRNARILNRGLRQAKAYAQALADGQTHWGRVPFLSDFVCLLSRGMTGMWRWRWAQRLHKITLDRKRCVKCGLCARLCPVHNVELDEYPRFGDRCEFCLRCCGFCPQGALTTNFNRGRKVYRAAGVEAEALRE
jgi:ferredoxin